MRQFRLVHIGVAAAMAAATVMAIGVVQQVRAAGETPSAFVPVAPCRLIDTRAGSDNIGARATPIASGEAAIFQVTGSNGNCTIPSTATAIATNATAVNATASSYITIYPADADPRPTASNLNFVAGAPPTPNQVTVGLSANGAIGIYNLSGTVDVIADIVGYYVPNADAGSGAQGPAGPAGPAGPICPAPNGCTAFYTGRDLALVTNSNVPYYDEGLCVAIPNNKHAILPLDLPTGAQVVAVRIRYADLPNTSGSTTYRLRSFDEAFSFVNRSTPYVTTDATINQAQLQLDAGRPAQSRTTQYEVLASSTGDFQSFCGAEVTYTLS